MTRRHQADVLDERPAERHVQHLYAAAHAEDRQLALQRRTHQRQLERIPLRLGGGKQRMRILPVPVRLDVAPGRQHDRVDRVECRPDSVDQLGQRHRQPPAANTGRCTPTPPESPKS